MEPRRVGDGLYASTRCNIVLHSFAILDTPQVYSACQWTSFSLDCALLSCRSSKPFSARRSMMDRGRAMIMGGPV